MPESVTDRPTKSHEQIFLLTKSERYFWDADAVREPAQDWGARDRSDAKHNTDGFRSAGQPPHRGLSGKYNPSGRNIRSVWNINPKPYSGSHFATFPPEIPRRCVLAGSSEKGCCAKCRAPWKRTTETEYKRHENWFGNKQDARHSRGNAGTAYNEPVARRTTGWRPSCSCDAGDPVPCIVLDPFVGSGTTVMVARNLGRVGVGLDLTYQQLAAERIAGPLFRDVVNSAFHGD